MTAGLLAAPTSVYASCGFEGIPDQYRPYNLSEGTTNTMGQPVIGGEAASTRAERECNKEQRGQAWYRTLGIGADDNAETLVRGMVDSFHAGGSIAFDVLASYRRAYRNPIDPDFDPLLWLDENREKYQIEIEDLSSFAGTRSEKEAYNLLVEVKERAAARSRIQRMDTMAQVTVRTIAALPDITIALCCLAAFSIAVKSAFRRLSKPGRETADA